MPKKNNQEEIVKGILFFAIIYILVKSPIGGMISSFFKITSSVLGVILVIVFVVIILGPIMKFFSK